MSGEQCRYHRSQTAKDYVAAKVDRLSALDFMRVPPEDWTDEQRAAFERWYPGDLDVAAEMVADVRFAAVLIRLGLVHSRRRDK